MSNLSLTWTMNKDITVTHSRGSSRGDHDFKHPFILRLSKSSGNDHSSTVLMTTTKSQPQCSLQETIRLNRFYSLDEDLLLKQVQEAFTPELERLKSAKAVEAGSAQNHVARGDDRILTPSQILYGADFDEVNRTLVGVLALRWIHNNDYERFTSGQQPNVRLHRVSFDWLRNLFHKGLRTPDDLFTLVLSMVINDLGKDPNLEEDYFLETGERLTDQNHDALLFAAARADMVPCLNMLDRQQRDDVMLGLQLGSELNAGQLAQAESVPINLEGLLDMRGHEHAFELKFMEQILDVAGAAGHADASGAKNFIEPVFEAFKTVHEVSLDIIEGNSSLRQGYDKVLTKRGDMLSVKGFRRLSVSNREERALLRLLTMGRTADKEQAELFQNAFDGLDQRHKDQLVAGLNIDGNENERAVLPYYMPAMISETLSRTKDLSVDERCKALTSLMRYLARVLGTTGTDIADLPEDFDLNSAAPGIVIERNMINAKEVIGSDDFKLNPDLLDTLEVPKGQILQRRRTSHSL